jgi:AraC-like DNA-binding protein
MTRYSAEQFPERERFEGWCDTFVRNISKADITRLDDRTQPFEAAVENLTLGRITVAHVAGTPVRFTRGPKQVTGRNRDFTLIVTRHGQTRASAGDSQSVTDTSGAQLVTHWQTGHVDFASESGDGGRFRVFRYEIPRDLMLAAVADPEALTFRALTGNQQALDYLIQYTDQVLLKHDFEDPRITERVGAHVYDLVATILGPTRGAAEVAHRRGIRAARLSSILAQIRTEYCDPAFGVESVARRHRVSPRYVQRLLEEHGETLSRQVLRLRLDRAAQLLADPARQRMRIHEIASVCGFTDLSYFNRSFRKRFGGTPRGQRA